MNPPRGTADGDERDAWLSQALRHAPDANIDAPPTLSETILHEARLAAAPGASAATPATPGRRRWHWLAAAWERLARPPVAAAFASVMMATLVGLLWRDRPLDETVQRPPAPAAAAPQPQAEAAPVEVSAASGAPAATVLASAPGPTRSARSEAVARARLAKPVDEPRQQRADAGAPPMPMPAPIPPPPPAAQTPPPTADKAAPPPGAVTALQDRRLSASARAGPGERGDAPLAELLAAVARQPDRWRWQRSGSEAQAMTANLQRWLARLDRATASQWRPAAARAPHDGTTALRLLRDGMPRATLGFDMGVWVESAGGAAPTTSMATLPTATIDALRTALDEAAP